MKRKILITVISLLIITLSGVFTVWFLIDHNVRKNIEIARNIYPGNAEDALISYLNDTNNSPWDRTHIAIWTLGQIKSEKALPFLKNLYRNDPEGKTCYRNHDKVLCQYELHKAITASEANWLPLHARLNK